MRARLYSKPPFSAKKPFLPWTMPMAPSMMTMSDAAENRAQEAEDKPQAAEELADGDEVADRPHHLDRLGQARPVERAEELLRAVDGEDGPDDEPHREQGAIDGRAVGGGR